MADKELLAKLAEVPLAKPGFDALNMSAPIMVAMNPEGKWENCKPENMEENRLRAVVQYLVNSKAISAAQSYCCQCAVENQKFGGKSNYVPVILMPIQSADECPFDMDCEVKKMKDIELKQPKKIKKADEGKRNEKEKEKRKIKKKAFVMQRLTDFDLISQW